MGRRPKVEHRDPRPVATGSFQAGLAWALRLGGRHHVSSLGIHNVSTLMLARMFETRPACIPKHEVSMRVSGGKILWNPASAHWWEFRAPLSQRKSLMTFRLKEGRIQRLAGWGQSRHRNSLTAGRAWPHVPIAVLFSSDQ